MIIQTTEKIPNMLYYDKNMKIPEENMLMDENIQNLKKHKKI